MNHLVFLLEEPSMRVLLEELLPKILPPYVTFQCVPHEGKSDLRESIPRKLKAWRTPGVRFIVLHDQESADCIKLKSDLTQCCVAGGRADTLIRIVCRALEAWLLGDLVAVEQGFQISGLAKHARKAKFRFPDRLNNPEQELKRLVPQYQELSGARTIAPFLDLKRNLSHSFHVFLQGLLRLSQDAKESS